MLFGFTIWWRHFISKSLAESNLPVLCSSQLLSFSFFTSLCHFFKKNVVNSLVWSSLGFAFDSTIVAYWSNTKSQLIFISRFSFLVLEIWYGPYDMVHMVWSIWDGSYDMVNMIFFISFADSIWWVRVSWPTLIKKFQWTCFNEMMMRNDCN